MIKVKTIENDDGTPNNQLYFVCSIIDSNKLSNCKVKNMIAFKCNGVFATDQMAEKLCIELKNKNKKIDNIIGETGRRHPFDVEKAEETEYQNQKLNKLSKRFQENREKLNLIKDQFKNEALNKNLDANFRKAQQLERMRKKAGIDTAVNERKIGMDYELTKEDLELIDETNKVDYLDETNKTESYVIFTPYLNTQYANLDEPSFKIRGEFSDIGEGSRGKNYMDKLKHDFPHDTIGWLKVGFWSPIYLDDTEDSPEMQIKKLNYVMKCYLEDFELAQKEHEERKTKELAKMKTDNDEKAKNIAKEKEDEKEKKEIQDEKKEEVKELSMDEKIAKARDIRSKLSNNKK